MKDMEGDLMMNVAIILAAGTGSRMKNITLPKQLISIDGKTVIFRVVETFFKHPKIDVVVVVYNQEYEDETKEALIPFASKIIYVKGGKTRQESSYNAIKALENTLQEEDIVLVHDAARVLLSDKIIDDNIVNINKTGAVITAIKVADTIIKGTEVLEETLNRDTLFLEQTPQTFRYGIIKKAHENALNLNLTNITDEAQLMKLIDVKCAIILGEKRNFKVTTDEDLDLLQYYLAKEND